MAAIFAQRKHTRAVKHSRSTILWRSEIPRTAEAFQDRHLHDVPDVGNGRPRCLQGHVVSGPPAELAPPVKVDQRKQE